MFISISISISKSIPMSTSISISISISIFISSSISIYIYVSRFYITIPRRLPRIVRLSPSLSAYFARFSSPPVSHICGPHVSLHPMMIPFSIPLPPPRNLLPNDKPSFSSRQSHTHPPRSRSRSKPDSLVKKAHHPSYRRSTIYHIPPFFRSPAFLQLPGIPPRLFSAPLSYSYINIVIYEI